MHDPTIGAWFYAWVWGLLISGITVLLHAAGLGVIVRVLILAFGPLPTGGVRLGRFLVRFSAATATASLLLASLHGTESILWAIAYRIVLASPDFQDAMLYSMSMMTTVGVVGADIAPHWRLMGTLEAANGMLLFGISTAFLFTLFVQAWRLLERNLAV